jgi:hypothetical protein
MEGVRIRREAEEPCLLGGSEVVVVGLAAVGDSVGFCAGEEGEDGEVGEMVREMELVKEVEEIEGSMSEENEKWKPGNTP